MSILKCISGCIEYEREGSKHTVHMQKCVVDILHMP